MLPVRYELGFYIAEYGIFIVTAARTSNLTSSQHFYEVKRKSFTACHLSYTLEH
jgi:hypothetical protein